MHDDQTFYDSRYTVLLHLLSEKNSISYSALTDALLAASQCQRAPRRWSPHCGGGIVTAKSLRRFPTSRQRNCYFRVLWAL